MFAMIVTGLLLLFAGIGYVIYLVSKHSKNPDRSSARVMRFILALSIIVLFVQDYIFNEVPSNSIMILFFVVVLIITSSLFIKNEEKNN